MLLTVLHAARSSGHGSWNATVPGSPVLTRPVDTCEHSRSANALMRQQVNTAREEHARLGGGGGGGGRHGTLLRQRR